MRNTLNAVANRMIGVDDAGVADAIMDYLRTLPAPMRKDIERLIFLFEYLPPLVIFRLSRFSRLSPQDQNTARRQSPAPHLRRQRGPCDPRCKVHGIRGLYVCDASIFPSLAGVNPMISIMALASLTAERIMEIRGQ